MNSLVKLGCVVSVGGRLSSCVILLEKLMMYGVVSGVVGSCV